MRIVIDCCNYFLNNHNHGDRAIYKMAAERLTHQWPGAEISWITLDPALMQQTIPAATFVTLAQRHHWQLVSAPQTARKPGLTAALTSLWDGSFPNREQQKLMRTIPDAALLVDKIRQADVVLALGGGAFSDHFPKHACGLLDTLAIGLIFGKPTALLSVGFEPVSNPALLEKCKQVLPRLSLIGCRESEIGPALLKEFGVPDERIYLTGDEAIALAYRLRPAQPGGAMGVNLRQSGYSSMDDVALQSIRGVLQETAQRYNAPLLGCPISMFGPSDVESIQKLTASYNGLVETGETLDEPEKVIQQVGRCRVVVTGSYHAAVFALSQGIPAVGIVRSLHYQSKLAGLATQFGVGCTLVDSHNTDFEANLRNAIVESWQTAEALREALLHKAQEQISAGEIAYRKLFEIVAEG